MVRRAGCSCTGAVGVHHRSAGPNGIAPTEKRNTRTEPRHERAGLSAETDGPPPPDRATAVSGEGAVDRAGGRCEGAPRQDAEDGRRTPGIAGLPAAEHQVPGL